MSKPAAPSPALPPPLPNKPVNKVVQHLVDDDGDEEEEDSEGSRLSRSNSLLNSPKPRAQRLPNAQVMPSPGPRAVDLGDDGPDSDPESTDTKGSFTAAPVSPV